MDLLDSPNLDVELRTVKAGAIKLSNSDERMLARIQVAIAKREVEHKAERIKRKIQELVEAGAIHNSGHRPCSRPRAATRPQALPWPGPTPSAPSIPSPNSRSR